MHLDDFRWMARQNRDNRGWLEVVARMPPSSIAELPIDLQSQESLGQGADDLIKEARAKFFLDNLPEQLSSVVDHGEWLRYPNEYGRVIFKFYDSSTIQNEELAPDQLLVELQGFDPNTDKASYGKISITHNGIELTILCVPHHEDIGKRLSLSFLQGPFAINDHAAIRAVLSALSLPSEVREQLCL